MPSEVSTKSDEDHGPEAACPLAHRSGPPRISNVRFSARKQGAGSPRGGGDLQSNLSESTFARATKPSRAPSARDKFLHHVQLHLHDRHDDELSDAVHRVDGERGF